VFSGTIALLPTSCAARRPDHLTGNNGSASLIAPPGLDLARVSSSQKTDFGWHYRFIYRTIPHPRWDRMIQPVWGGARLLGDPQAEFGAARIAIVVEAFLPL
jgi:hypothetical protein